MADPITNAQFAQSLFAPAAQAISGFGQAGLQKAQMGYQERLRDIKRMQDIEDANAEATQREALVNLQLAGQERITNAVTDRQMRAAEKAATAAEKRASAAQIAALRATYANLGGKEKIPDNVEDDESKLAWYAGKIGERKREQDIETKIPEARTLARNLGLNIDIPKGTDAEAALNLYNDAIADQKNKTSKSQAKRLREAEVLYQNELERIETNTPKEEAQAFAAAKQAIPKAVMDNLQSEGLAKGMTDYASVLSTLRSFPNAPGAAEFDAAYSAQLDALRERRKKGSKLPILQKNLESFARFGRNEGVASAYDDLLMAEGNTAGINPDALAVDPNKPAYDPLNPGGRGAGGDTPRDLSTAGPASVLADPQAAANALRGGGRAAAATFMKTYRAPVEPDYVPMTRAEAAARAAALARGQAVAPRQVRGVAPTPLMDPRNQGAVPTVFTRDLDAGLPPGEAPTVYTRDLVAPANQGYIPTVRTREDLPTVFTRDLPEIPTVYTGDIPTLRVSDIPATATASNRRLDSVEDYVRRHAQALRQVLSPSTRGYAEGATPPGGMPWDYNPNPDVLVQDLLSRYDSLRDKTSPQAALIEQQLRQTAPWIFAPAQ